MTTTDEQPDPTDGQPGEEQEPVTFDAQFVRRLREEAAGYRTKAREAAEALAGFEQERDGLREALRAARLDAALQPFAPRLVDLEPVREHLAAAPDLFDGDEVDRDRLAVLIDE